MLSKNLTGTPRALSNHFSSPYLNMPYIKNSITPYISCEDFEPPTNSGSDGRSNKAQSESKRIARFKANFEQIELKIAEVYHSIKSEALKIKSTRMKTESSKIIKELIVLIENLKNEFFKQPRLTTKRDHKENTEEFKSLIKELQGMNEELSKEISKLNIELFNAIAENSKFRSLLESSKLIKSEQFFQNSTKDTKGECEEWIKAYKHKLRVVASRIKDCFQSNNLPKELEHCLTSLYRDLVDFNSKNDTSSIKSKKKLKEVNENTLNNSSKDMINSVWNYEEGGLKYKCLITIDEIQRLVVKEIKGRRILYEDIKSIQDSFEKAWEVLNVELDERGNSKGIMQKQGNSVNKIDELKMIIEKHKESFAELKRSKDIEIERHLKKIQILQKKLKAVNNTKVSTSLKEKFNESLEQYKQGVMKRVKNMEKTISLLEFKVNCCSKSKVYLNLIERLGLMIKQKHDKIITVLIKTQRQVLTLEKKLSSLKSNKLSLSNIKGFISKQDNTISDISVLNYDRWRVNDIMKDIITKINKRMHKKYLDLVEAVNEAMLKQETKYLAVSKFLHIDYVNGIGCIKNLKEQCKEYEKSLSNNLILKESSKVLLNKKIFIKMKNLILMRVHKVIENNKHFISVKCSQIDSFKESLDKLKKIINTKSSKDTKEALTQTIKAVRNEYILKHMKEKMINLFNNSATLVITQLLKHQEQINNLKNTVIILRDEGRFIAKEQISNIKSKLEKVVTKPLETLSLIKNQINIVQMEQLAITNLLRTKERHKEIEVCYVLMAKHIIHTLRQELDDNKIKEMNNTLDNYIRDKDTLKKYTRVKLKELQTEFEFKLSGITSQISSVGNYWKSNIEVMMCKVKDVYGLLTSSINKRDTKIKRLLNELWTALNREIITYVRNINTQILMFNKLNIMNLLPSEFNYEGLVMKHLKVYAVMIDDIMSKSREALKEECAQKLDDISMRMELIVMKNRSLEKRKSVFEELQGENCTRYRISSKENNNVKKRIVVRSKNVIEQIKENKEMSMKLLTLINLNKQDMTNVIKKSKEELLKIMSSDNSKQAVIKLRIENLKLKKELRNLKVFGDKNLLQIEKKANKMKVFCLEIKASLIMKLKNLQVQVSKKLYDDQCKIIHFSCKLLQCKEAPAQIGSKVKSLVVEYKKLLTKLSSHIKEGGLSPILKDIVDILMRCKKGLNSTS